MKFILNTISTIFILFLSLISAILPRKARGYFGKMLGYSIMIISPSRKQITLDNLTYAFPDKSKEWIEKHSSKALLILELCSPKCLPLFLFPKINL